MKSYQEFATHLGQLLGGATAVRSLFPVMDDSRSHPLLFSTSHGFSEQNEAEPDLMRKAQASNAFQENALPLSTTT